MKTLVAVVLSAIAIAVCSTAQATPLDELREAKVSQLEFGSFRLEVALMAIKDWPVAVEGASVSYQPGPDRIEIVVAVKKIPAESFRAACSRTLGRIRELLYVDADGVAPMGRSYLSSYFRGPWRGAEREAAGRALDANTLIRVDIVAAGSCRAALVNAPISFEAIASR